VLTLTDIVFPLMYFFFHLHLFLDLLTIFGFFFASQYWSASFNNSFNNTQGERFERSAGKVYNDAGKNEGAGRKFEWCG